VSDSVSSLAQRQNQPGQLRLLRAASVCHLRAQRLDALRLGVSVVVAAAGVFAALASSAATPITTLGGLWALAYATGLAAWGGNELRRAALLQEMFDVELFELPWNEVAAGQALGAEEVSHLSQRCRITDKRLRDYYLVPVVPRPYDVLGCQQQNLGWAARVRRRYSRVLLIGVGTWSGLGLVIGWLAKLTVPELVLRWYIPSLAVLLLALDTYRSQRDAAATRERVLALVEALVKTATQQPTPQVVAPLLTLARQVQDVIFQARTNHIRAPNLFFRRFQTTDRTDFETAMTELQRLFHAGPEKAR
jgi:hypothetical protein